MRLVHHHVDDLADALLPLPTKYLALISDIYSTYAIQVISIIWFIE